MYKLNSININSPVLGKIYITIQDEMKPRIIVQAMNWEVI